MRQQIAPQRDQAGVARPMFRRNDAHQHAMTALRQGSPLADVVRELRRAYRQIEIEWRSGLCQ